jgi:hypothetical protein
MSRTLTTLEKKLPRPTTVAEAIQMDSRLEYINIPKEVQEEIVEKIDEVGLKSIGFEYNDKTYTLDETILKQVSRYTVRANEHAQIIVYNDEDGTHEVIRAVSALFRPIPLKEVWAKAVERLGEPIKEIATSQAIIAQFNPVLTKYSQSGEVLDTDYEVFPTIAFSYNFAEKSFQLGFTVGVPFCANQIFTFFGDSKIVHNVHKINAKDFTIESALDTLMANLKTLEEIIEKAQKTALPLYEAPVIYWKGCRTQTKPLELVYEQHFGMVSKKGQGNLTYWDAIMNLTWVSTHDIENVNSSVEMSTVAGKALIEMGELQPDDYVKATGFYMEHKRRTTGQTWKDQPSIFQRINLVPLMSRAVAVLEAAIQAIWDADVKKEEDRRIAEDEAAEAESEPIVQEVREKLNSLTPEEKSKMFTLDEEE